MLPYIMNYIDELIKDGWAKEQAKLSLKSIKNALKHAKKSK